MTTPSNLPSGEEAASALAHAGHGIEGGSGWQRSEPLVVTALFDAVEGVDRALDALYGAGVPRDLIEVVVSRAAAQKFSDGDPYAKAGLFESVAIHPTRKVFLNEAAAG